MSRLAAGFLNSCICAFLFVSSGSAQTERLDQRISYRTPAKRTSVVLQELSGITGVKLETPGSAGSEVLLISVTDVPIRELLNRIASTTSSEWQIVGETWRLVPNVTLQRQQDAQRRQKRIDAVQKALKQLESTTRPKAPEAEDTPDGKASPAAQFPMGGDGMPASIALAQIALGLDARAIADVEPGERIVFSNFPTRMQLALPRNWPTAQERLIKAQNTMAAARKEAEDLPRTPEEKQAMEWAEQMGFMGSMKPITQSPAKALIAFARNSLWGGITITVALFDGTGKTLFSGNTSLNVQDDEALIDMGDFELPNPRGEPTKKPEPPIQDQPMKFSEHAEELLTLISLGDTDMLNRQPSDGLKAKLLRPDTFDPLSFTHSEALLEASARKKAHMVACLPDGLIGLFRASAKVPNLPLVYLDQLKKGNHTIVEEKDGWIVVSPKEPSLSRKNRTDRVALSALLQAAESKGIPSLDDLAAYAIKNEDPMRTPAGMYYLAIMAPSAVSSGMAGIVSWDMMRFYGHTALAQRQQLASGLRLPFSGLNSAQRAILNKLSYGANARLEVDRPGENKPDAGGFMVMIQRLLPPLSKDYRDEPTEVMPNGVPAAGSVSLSIESDSFVFPVNAKGARNTRMGPLGADELAAMKYFMEQPMFEQASGMLPSMEKLVVGSRSNLLFTFQLAPGVSMRHTLHDDQIAKNASAVAWDNLPAAFRDKIGKRIEEFKKNPLPMGLGMPGSGAIPPPVPQI